MRHVKHRILGALAALLVVGAVGCAGTTSVNAITPNEKVPGDQVAGARYRASGLSGTPTDGDAVALAVDASGNLLTSGASVAPVDSDELTGTIASTGTTKATIAALSAGKSAYAYGFFGNTTASTVNVTVFSMPSGHVVRGPFQLAASPSGFAVDWVQNMHSQAGESLVYSVDSAVTGATFSGVRFWR